MNKYMKLYANVKARTMFACEEPGISAEPSIWNISAMTGVNLIDVSLQ